MHGILRSTENSLKIFNNIFQRWKSMTGIIIFTQQKIPIPDGMNVHL